MTSIPSLAPVVHTGVDWISLSCNQYVRAAELRRWCDAAQEKEKERGNAERFYTSHGYEGRSVGQVSVATRRGEVLCQLSGSEAYAHWRDVAQYATNVSRVDLAVTVRPAIRTNALARESYSPSTRAAAGRGRPIELTLIQSQDRGDTLYVGSRKSDQMGRLYDKGKESKDKQWEGTWRYEVQYRRQYAVDAVRKLASFESDSACCQETVSRWFNARGVACSVSAGDSAITSKPSPKVSDDEQWLSWVRKCVQPRAQKMVAKYGWRYVAEACTGRITTYEQWETLLRDVEFELELLDDGGGC